MTCPKCAQSVGQPTAEGACPLCGFNLAPFRARLMTLYALTTAFFMSTLAYCGVVYVLSAHPLPHQAQGSQEIMTYTLLVLAVLVFGVAIKVGQRLPLTTSMNQLQRLFIVKMALIESIAIYGLLLYLLFGSMQWFAVFLGLSLLGFMQTGSQMPSVADQLARLAVLEDASPK